VAVESHRVMSHELSNTFFSSNAGPTLTVGVDPPGRPNPKSTFSIPRNARLGQPLNRLVGTSEEIGIFWPNNQRQHRTLHIQKDVLPYALC